MFLKKCSSDQGTPLTLKAEGQKFSNFLRSLKNLGPLSTVPIVSRNCNLRVTEELESKRFLCSYFSEAI